MDNFHYRNGMLHCEHVAMDELAIAVGTPAYVYSTATLRNHYWNLVDAFSPLNPIICFSVKSLANTHVLRILKAENSGFDVVSGGELERCLAVDAETEKIVFAGVGKTDREIRRALEVGIGWFNVESEQEFENISTIARETGCRTGALLRVNPDVYDPDTHAYTTTGKKETKFGVDIDRAEAFFNTYGNDPAVILQGIHLHIGSPIYSSAPYRDAIRRTMDLITVLRGKGYEISVLDLGGGFAADYTTGASPLAADYAKDIVPLLKDAGLTVILEPGRQIACNAGILLSQVLYVKKGGEKTFAIVDASIADLIRPALYQAEHFIYPVKIGDDESPDRRVDYKPSGGEKVDIVGGVCETCDVLGHDRVLPPLKRGDLLSVFSAGAYGFVMSSQYNSRPRACEILVDGDSYRVIRRRETADDLLALEKES